eukprot:TRINITY_DN33045_c0_g1_i1.p1 TRINITY_DN33045_c0_g1~~TRINITY_DN33045_c0_g1_i1.p1  ORF type:complete len:596 (-),score=100.30 TRINITY_DN33045_c0_g1_i1:21-1808(-)
MRPQSPICNHPTLLLLEKCKTPTTFKQAHAHMITTGLAHHTFPLSRLLLFSSLPPLSSTLGSSYPTSIFNQIPNPTIFLYNTLISSLASTNNTHIALSLYSHLLSHKTPKPNNYTYPSLFKACGSHPWIHHGLALHAHVLKFLGSTYDHFLHASLLNFYSKCGKLELSRYLFNQIQDPDLAAWNSIISAYAHGTSTCSDDASSCIEALFLFDEMQMSLIRPNEITFVAVIGACADLGALSQGAWAHAYIERHGLELNRFVATALIDMYAKCGCINLAIQVFDSLPKRDTMCYNSMIRGLAIHGLARPAVELFNVMDRDGVAVDYVTFVVMMCACAHAGLVDEGRRCFNSMNEVYGIEPKIEHYGCLVDLLGRAGRLDEAHEVVWKMPMRPNAVIWRSLLGASRIHGNMELGELALKHLTELEPESGGNYVLLSNIYANMNHWEDVRRVRKVMKDKGINKMPGHSLVEMDGEIHEFILGDRAHPRSREIYAMLDEMGRRLHEYGHKPSTQEVLFDMGEEEKEDALSYHSEKIAIAFALVASDSTVPIRIIKNLRVCGDCHSSAKLISRIYGREIILRDRIRFHHFRYGACSCLDYW